MQEVLIVIYQVEITETLQKIVSIKAINEDFAVIKARKMYHNEDIVLDSSDYIETSYDIIDIKLDLIHT